VKFLGEFIVEPWTLFLDSFKKFKLQLVHAAFFDLCFYAGFLLVYVCGFFLFNNIILNLPIQVGKSLTPVLAAMIGGIVLLFALLFINTVIFKNLAWNYTLERKTKLWSFIKFSLATVLPWFAVFLLLRYGLTGFAQVVVIPLYALIYIYFIGIARTLYDGKIKKTIGRAFEIGIFKLYKFILPAVLMFLVLFIASGLTSFLINVNDNLFFITSTVVFLMLFAWARYYFTFIVKSCTERKNKK